MIPRRERAWVTPSIAFILRYIGVPLLTSILVSAALTYIVRETTRRLGLLDKPGSHKQHEAPTPTLGGLAVFLAFCVGCLISGRMSPALEAILVSSFALVAVGVWDDIWGVRAKLKLGMLLLSTYWLWRNDIYLDVLGLSGLAALTLTFLWVGLVSSAFNGVDNADGAAAGLAVISCVSTFAISWTSWQHDLATVSVVLAGACVGFLLFNFPWPRATIFLGDSGSLFLGFGLASLTILGEWSEIGWKSAIIACLLVFVPLFDFIFILLSRGLDGRYKHWEDPIRMCGRDHVSHRLRYLGLSPRLALLLMYSLATLAGLLAFVIARNPDALSPPRAIQGGLCMLLLLLGLKRVPLPRDAFAEA